jgi:hypothetical protein
LQHHERPIAVVTRNPQRSVGALGFGQFIGKPARQLLYWSIEWWPRLNSEGRGVQRCLRLDSRRVLGFLFGQRA